MKYKSYEVKFFRYHFKILLIIGLIFLIPGFLSVFLMNLQPKIHYILYFG